ncbi:MAG: glycosyltransferase [Clostridia bacterium]|nr:glycosyltransferase [Clostridia bacterium]
MKKNELLVYYDDRFNLSLKTDENSIKKDADTLAKDILEYISPKGAVEFSSKGGYLLEALKNYGVSVYDVENTRFPDNIENKSIPKDKSTDVLKKIKSKPGLFYDLGIIFNYLHYLNDEEAQSAIQNMCDCCFNVLFYQPKQSNPALNSHSLDHWSRKFAENGLFRDINNPLSSKYQGLYVFSKDINIGRTIRNYEKSLCCDQSKIETLNIQNAVLSDKIKNQNEKIELLEQIIRKEKKNNKNFSEKLKQSEAKFKNLLQDYDNVKSYAVKNGYVDPAESLKAQNIDTNVYVVAKDPNEELINEVFLGKSLDVSWFLSSKEALNQRTRQFNKFVKFSVLLQVDDNITKSQLSESIDSVINQTYENWELLISYVGQNQNGQKDLLSEYKSKFSKIKFVDENQSLTIPQSFQRLSVDVSGNYVAFLNQGDVLHPAALFETLQAIIDEDADIIYTDNASFKYRPISVCDKFFKPEFSMEALLQYNFMNHFLSFKTKLLKRSGWVKVENEINDLHSLIIKLAHNADKIYHIQKILYYVNEQLKSKPQDASNIIMQYLHKTDKDAFYVKRLKNNVYDLSYKSTQAPLVSIIITNIGDKSYLKMCIDSVLMNTHYKNYEIIAVNKSYISQNDLIFDEPIFKDMFQCDFLFEKYEALLDEDSILTKYNKRFSERELEKFNNALQNYNEQKKREDDILTSEITADKRVKLLEWASDYNKALMNNLALKEAKGEYCVFIDSSVTVENKEWLDNLISALKNPKVGISSCKLVNSLGYVESMGVTHSTKKLLRDLYCGEKLSQDGYYGGLRYPCLCSLVQDACFAVRKDDILSVGAFSEKYPVYFSTADLCLKYRDIEKLIITMPNALAHTHQTYLRENLKYECALTDEVEETKIFLKEWGAILHNDDPFYHKNFTKDGKTYVEDEIKDKSSNLCLKVLDE